MTNAHHAIQPSHVPSLRIWLCGPFQMEWVDPVSGQTHALTERDIRGTDATQALSLLKVLLCQLGRQAHRDWIMEQFWPEQVRSVATHRFHNITSAFRKHFCSPDGVPGATQQQIACGQDFVYEYVAPTAGTYFYHSHVVITTGSWFVWLP